MVRVDRKSEFSEQKLICPICGTGNKTYRVLDGHCKEFHAGHVMVLVCPVEHCGWHCGFSLQCYVHHLLYEHSHSADGQTQIVLYRKEGDYSQHSQFCEITMEKRLIPNQAELILKMEQVFARKEARRELARAAKEAKIAFREMKKEFDC